MTIEQIRALNFWTGPVVIEPLAGGITNHNYLVRAAQSLYVARVCAERSLLGIDRRNEVRCQRHAAHLGIAPPVVHEEAGILISEYLVARTMAPAEVRDVDWLVRLAKTLRVLHASWDRITGELLYFCPFQTVRTYYGHALKLGADLPSELEELVADVCQLSQELAPFRPTLCHNDLLAANLLDDGEKIWIVDWEYSGMGNPWFDLASVSSNSALSAEEERLFLTAYLGQPPTHQIQRQVHILKSASLMREGLWAAVQSVTADIDFDFGAYAVQNFAAYQVARAELRGLDSENSA